jgi:hypothetical protein
VCLFCELLEWQIWCISENQATRIPFGSACVPWLCASVFLFLCFFLTLSFFGDNMSSSIGEVKAYTNEFNMTCLFQIKGPIYLHADSAKWVTFRSPC